MTPDVADRWDAIPFAVQDRKLVLVAVAPSDFGMLDEVAFATDRNVVALVAPEARVWSLLRRHYGIDRQLRGIEVDFQPGTSVRPAAREADRSAAGGPDLMDQAGFDALYAGVTTPPPVAAPISQAPALPSFEDDDEVIDLTELIEPEAPPAPPPAAPPPPVRPAAPRPMNRATAMALKAVLQTGDRTRPKAPPTMVLPAIDPATLQPVTTPPAAPPPADTRPPGLRQGPPPRAPEPEPAPLDFADAIAALSGVEDRDAIARIVLRHARARFKRAVLLQVRRGSAWGWAGLGEGLSPAAVRRMKLTLGRPGVLETVVSSRAHFLGPLAKTDENIRLLKQLGGGVPRSAILLPVLAQGRVVNVLYADQGRGAQVDPGAVGDLLILATRISQSWDRLVSRVR
jgi:hypothetical protein